MLQPAIEPAVGGQKSRAQLGDQLFHGIGGFTEAPAQSATETRAVTSPVTQLVQCGRVERCRIGEVLTIRQVDQVIWRRIEGTEALMPDVGTRFADDSLRQVLAGPISQRCGLMIDVRQPVDLVEVEDGKDLKQRNEPLLWFARVGQRLGILLLDET